MPRNPFIARLITVAALAAAAGCAPAPPAAPATGDVVLIVLENTRADHLSAYGYPKPTSPNLDRLATEGQRYDSAWSQAPWTLPAVATILTGQPPWIHGAMRGADGIHPVAEGVPTLAERMKNAGYATAAVINVVWCGPHLSALDRGFDRYDYHETDATNKGHRNARATTDAALDWVDGNGDRPFFLVVHNFDPHLTNDPPASIAPWVDDAVVRRVAAALAQNPTDRLKPVFEALDGEVSYEVLRIVAAWTQGRAQELGG